VKITENVIYSTFTSSTKEEEDYRVLLVIDEYTLHDSNILKLSFMLSVPYYPVSRLIEEPFIMRVAPYKEHIEFFRRCHMIALAKTFKMSSNSFMKCFMKRSYQQKMLKTVP
jgi:hypothetical protein